MGGSSTLAPGSSGTSFPTTLGTSPSLGSFTGQQGSTTGAGPLAPSSADSNPFTAMQSPNGPPGSMPQQDIVNLLQGSNPLWQRLIAQQSAGSNPIADVLMAGGQA